tara:strand:- start:588 stop:1589 length:1002 start_codon:yes stop_codon:yes gene_type:complete
VICRIDLTFLQEREPIYHYISPTHHHQNNMSCLRFRVPLSSKTASLEINFATLVKANGGTKSNKKQIKQKTNKKQKISNSNSDEECEEADESEEKSFDFDTLDFNSISDPAAVLGGHSNGSGNLTSVIERLERTYANPLWMAPMSEDEYEDEDFENLLHTEPGMASSASLVSTNTTTMSEGGVPVVVPNKKKRKRKQRGDCYESDDSFIDDSELIAEKVEHVRQQQSITKHGGFFVNSGEIITNDEDNDDIEFIDDSPGKGKGGRKKRKIIKTGNPRNDFITQHLGVLWNGHTQLLQQELDAFTTLAHTHMQENTRRLPQILEAPLEQLGKKK